jgi:glycerol dehydrogenase
VIIGAGGGKTLDTAKVVGYHLKSSVALIPTIASTDAPTSSVAVIYREDHRHEGSIKLRKNPDLILVDTAIIAQAPVRFLVAGMGDALGTKFEAEACAQSMAKNIPGFRPTLAALALARLTYDILIKYGLEAKCSVERKSLNPALEKVIEANILLSGLGFESGGLAAAHAIHFGLTLARESSKTYHGEQVAFGTLVQLFMEDRPENEIMEVGQFSISVGLPICLEDLFIEEFEIPVVAEESCRAGIMNNMPFPVPKI